MADTAERIIQTDHSVYFVKGAFRRFYIPALLSSFWLAVAGVADSVFVGNGIGAAAAPAERRSGVEAGTAPTEDGISPLPIFPVTA